MPITLVTVYLIADAGLGTVESTGTNVDRAIIICYRYQSSVGKIRYGDRLTDDWRYLCLDRCSKMSSAYGILLCVSCGYIGQLTITKAIKLTTWDNLSIS